MRYPFLPFPSVSYRPLQRHRGGTRVRHTSFALISDCTRLYIPFPPSPPIIDSPCVGVVRGLSRGYFQKLYLSSREPSSRDSRGGSRPGFLIRSANLKLAKHAWRLIQGGRATSASIFGKPRMFRIPGRGGRRGRGEDREKMIARFCHSQSSPVPSPGISPGIPKTRSFEPSPIRP